MTNFAPTTSGTETSVPVAGLPFAIPRAATAPVQVAPPPVVSTPAPVAPTSVPTVAPPPTPAGFRTHGPWVVGALYTVVPSGPLLLIAEPDAVEGEEKQWYAITRGLYVGVTLSNSLAVNAVSGVSRSGMKAMPLKPWPRRLQRNARLQYGRSSSPVRFLSRFSWYPPFVSRPLHDQDTSDDGTGLGLEPPHCFIAADSRRLRRIVLSLYYSFNLSTATRTRDSPGLLPATRLKESLVDMSMLFSSGVPGKIRKEDRLMACHVPNNIHRGYKSVAEPTPLLTFVGPPIPALPVPLGINDDHQNPLNGSETLDDFCKSQNSQQPLNLLLVLSLECQLNTLGVSGAVHESVKGKIAALRKYTMAVEKAMLCRVNCVRGVQVSLSIAAVQAFNFGR
ncbi:hypothetical protein B0H13DRAFT_1926024 [Mycena leptocephala]|nr:hypothetical protein B0H13DRAFT_1926024 [Mycena leptocephala]